VVVVEAVVAGLMGTVETAAAAVAETAAVSIAGRTVEASDDGAGTGRIRRSPRAMSDHLLLRGWRCCE